MAELMIRDQVAVPETYAAVNIAGTTAPTGL